MTFPQNASIAALVEAACEAEAHALISKLVANLASGIDEAEAAQHFARGLRVLVAAERLALQALAELAT